MKKHPTRKCPTAFPEMWARVRGNAAREGLYILIEPWNGKWGTGPRSERWVFFSARSGQSVLDFFPLTSRWVGRRGVQDHGAVKSVWQAMRMAVIRAQASEKVHSW